MLAAATPMMLVGTGLSCLTILQSEMLDAASGAGFVTATGIGMVIVTEILQMLLLHFIYCVYDVYMEKRYGNVIGTSCTYIAADHHLPGNY